MNKFYFAIIIFVCWSTSIANDIETSFEFPIYVNEFKHLCKDEIIFFNFANTTITSIGQDFISSPLITCLNFTNTRIQSIEKGAFDKLPNLTLLILSDNDIINFFDFGSHENLKILIMNSARNHANNYYSHNYIVDIFEKYPNLEILSVHSNYISDLQTSLKEIPFPKLKILDLSSNYIKDISFVKLLSNNLYFLDLHSNLFTSLTFDKKQVNLLALNLDNNNLKYIKNNNLYNKRDHSYDNSYDKQNIQHYGHIMYDQYDQYNSYNFALVMAGLETLHYLSISGNEIDFIESNSFENTNELVYLNLSRNKITHLHPETFEKLQSLKSLDLSFNQLEAVPQISNVTMISTLSLNCNNIKNILSNAFVQMPKLIKLLLGGNHIDEIYVKAFAHLPHLEILDLSKNKINFLPKEFSESLTSLKYLNLNDNKFTSLESLSLTNALSLKEVHLAMNPLQYLNVSYVKTLPQNFTVNLMQESNSAWNIYKC